MERIPIRTTPAIRVMAPDAENIYALAGGEPVIVRVKEGKF